MVPYWYKGSQGLALDPLSGHEDQTRNPNGDRVGEYYLCPVESGQDCILNPFIYAVDGKDTLLTTVSSPIKINGETQGCVGIDVSIDVISELAYNISQILYAGESDVYIISQNGYIAGNSNKQNLGSRLNDDEIIRLIGDKGAKVEMGQEQIMASAPIKFDNSSSMWHVVIIVPTDIVYQEIKELSYNLEAANDEARNMQIILAVVITVIAVLIAFYLAGSIAKPIKQTVGMLNVVAQGDLTPRLDVNTEDETRALADACNTFLDKTQPLIREVSSCSDELSVVAQTTLKVSSQSWVM